MTSRCIITYDCGVQQKFQSLKCKRCFYNIVLPHLTLSSPCQVQVHARFQATQPCSHPENEGTIPPVQLQYLPVMAMLLSIGGFELRKMQVSVCIPEGRGCLLWGFLRCPSIESCDSGGQQTWLLIPQKRKVGIGTERAWDRARWQRIYPIYMES